VIKFTVGCRIVNVCHLTIRTVFVINMIIRSLKCKNWYSFNMMVNRKLDLIY